MNKMEMIDFLTKTERSSNRYRKVYNDPDYDKRFKRIFEDFNITGFEKFKMVKDIYNFLYEISGVCEICENDLEFISFIHGYKECKVCKENKSKKLIKDKKELYHFLMKKPLYSASKIKNTGDRAISYLKNNYPFIYNYLERELKDFEPETLYNFLNGKNKCDIKECNNKPKFIGFAAGYLQFCSKECRNNWWSEKQTKNNTCYRIKDVKKMGEKISKSIKKRIAEGKFTPCVTNSWAHSKVNVNIKQNGNEIIVPVRSSFEALFQILNPNCKYEKLRIPYNYKGNNHTYIVDFIDDINKIVYEVKPSTLLSNEKNLIKEHELIKWCKKNNYEYKVITEKWVSENYNENIIKGQQNFNKLKRLLTRYEN